jgi:hypothetical protein
VGDTSFQVDYERERQKRSAVRVDVDSLPVQIWRLGRNLCDPVGAAFVNLSGSGGLIEYEKNLPVGLNVHCRFALAGGPLNSVDASIVRSLPSPIPGVFKMGLHFDIALEGKRDILVKWIFEEIGRQRRLHDSPPPLRRR